MKQTKIHLEQAGRPAASFRALVSLHSHTLHSRETLGFVYRLADRSRLCRTALERGESAYRKKFKTELDLEHGWWTPPLAPYAAWRLECSQIEAKFQRTALVSLTDHDDIEAPLALRVLDECRNLPVSVEWTVPYGPTFFHLGVHNIAPDRARSIMRELERFTATGRTVELESILSLLARNEHTLVVFNHPCWDENAIGCESHRQWVTQFLRHYKRYIHALELNGLRPWPENRDVMQLALEFEKPLISGGDRHCLEPNTILDLTTAETFPEFVEQVRSGWTDVFVTAQYSEPYSLRVLQCLEHAVAYHEDHGRGWKRWSDRVFYRCEDGIVRPLTELFPRGLPSSLRLFVSAVRWLHHRSLRQTVRLAFPKRQEVTL